MKKIVVILLGAPASGKGTFKSQIIKYMEKENLKYTAIETSSLLKKKFQKIIATGDLVNDQDVIEVVKEKLAITEKVVILDGFPRTLVQAESLLSLKSFDFKIIKLEATKEEIIKRVEYRRICPKCGTTYNLSKKDLCPKIIGICDRCTTPLTKRDDDKNISKRLDIYYQNIKEVEDYLKLQNTTFCNFDSRLLFTSDAVEGLLKVIVPTI